MYWLYGGPFIILVGLTMTWFSEKMMISYSYIRGFMRNLHKKSWMISNARLSRLTTKSGSISSKPLLDPNRRSHSATSIQAKNANNQRTQTQLLSSTAKSKLLLGNKSSDDLLRNGTFNLQTSTKIKKKEVPVKTQQRPLSFTSRG